MTKSASISSLNKKNFLKKAFKGFSSPSDSAGKNHPCRDSIRHGRHETNKTDLKETE